MINRNILKYQEEKHVRAYSTYEPAADLCRCFPVSDLRYSLTQSSAGPFESSSTSVVSINTSDISAIEPSSDRDHHTDASISSGAPSPSATPSPVPTEIPETEKVSPEAENGVWTPDGTNWKFMVDGTAYTGWLTDTDGHRYYFNKDGIMQTGWITLGKKRYYLDEDGIMQTGTITVNGKKYTLAADGSLKK